MGSFVLIKERLMTLTKMVFVFPEELKNSDMYPLLPRGYLFFVCLIELTYLLPQLRNLILWPVVFKLLTIK